MTLGEYLHEKRIERGWTLQALAEKVGCRRQYLHAIERGDISPSKAKLRALAIAFGRDGLVLRLHGGDVPEEVIAALLKEPELLKFLADNARHPDLSTFSSYLRNSVN